MLRKAPRVPVLLLSAFLALLAGSSAPAQALESEADLLARIQREKKPVKKAKLEIRLGKMRLRRAIEAHQRGNLDECLALLAEYLERMRNSWETLRSSGRQAARHPQGFKELDIALREDSRLLEDLKRRVPFTHRDAVEKTIQEAEEIRSEVLRALFPAERPRGADEKPAPRPAPSHLIARFMR